MYNVPPPYTLIVCEVGDGMQMNLCAHMSVGLPHCLYIHFISVLNGLSEICISQELLVVCTFEGRFGLGPISLKAASLAHFKL